MSGAKQYFQCRLRHGYSETTGWIEARGAIEGATVELLPSRELWKVVEVYEHGLPEDVLKEQAAAESPQPAIGGGDGVTHDPDDFSAWRAIRVALGLAPRPDMTPEGRARRALRRARLRALLTFSDCPEDPDY